MAIHKISLGEFDEIDYHLIAIHTLLEDYRLAYFINKNLPVILGKSDDEVQINVKEGETKFSRYYYHDAENGISWNLVQNKNEVIQHNKGNAENLFSDIIDEISTKVYLLPEFKKADYFLKIDNIEDSIDVEELRTKLKTIENISTAYSVDIEQIKSKNNLIF